MIGTFILTLQVKGVVADKKKTFWSYFETLKMEICHCIAFFSSFLKILIFNNFFLETKSLKEALVVYLDINILELLSTKWLAELSLNRVQVLIKLA